MGAGASISNEEEALAAGHTEADIASFKSQLEPSEQVFKSIQASKQKDVSLCVRLVKAAREANDPSLVTAGVLTLGNIASIPSKGAELGKAGACAEVVAAMNAFPADREVQFKGCFAVQIFITSHPPNAHILVEAGATKSLAQAVHNFPKDSTLLNNGTRALEIIASYEDNQPHHDDPHPTRDPSSVGVSGITKNDFKQVLDSKEKDIKKCMSLLCSVLADAKASTDTLVLCYGLLRLGDLACFRKKALQLGHAGACTLVVQCMDAFPEDRDLQYYGCYAMKFLSSNEPKCVAWLCKTGALRALETAVSHFGDDASVRQESTKVVNLIGEWEEDEGDDSGPPPAIHHDEEAPEADGLRHSLLIASKEEAEKIAAGIHHEEIERKHFNELLESKKKDTTEYMRLLTKVFETAKAENDPTLLGHGLMRTGDLACFRNKGLQLGELGACRLITECMDTFQKDRDLQYYGCYAMKLLALNHPPNVALFSEAGGDKALERAMENFGEDPSIRHEGNKAAALIFSEDE